MFPKTTMLTSTCTFRRCFSQSTLAWASVRQSRPAFNLDISSHSAPSRPDDLTYFTGNPNYFTLLMKVNSLMRRHNLTFQDKSIYEGIGSFPKWMSKIELTSNKQFKLTDRLYDELIYKFNALYTVQGKLALYSDS
jgi:hypothetical protein